jgi:hypothetical protein
MEPFMRTEIICSSIVISVFVFGTISKFVGAPQGIWCRQLKLPGDGLGISSSLKLSQLSAGIFGRSGMLIFLRMFSRSFHPGDVTSFMTFLCMLIVLRMIRETFFWPGFERSLEPFGLVLLYIFRLGSGSLYSV